MSIKGIDAQMMITRLPDNVREASAIQKRPEVAQDVLAAQQRLNDAQDQSKVAKTTESEMENIRTDVEEGRGGSYGGEGNSGKKEDKPDDIEQELKVSPSCNIIDIKI